MNIVVANTWPATLPLPSVDYSFEPLNTTIQSSTENAKIAARERFKCDYGTIALRWHLSPSQLEVFESFFLEELGNGTACFSIELRHPLNSGLTNWCLRFTGGYDILEFEGLRIVSGELEMVRKMALPEKASAHVPFIVEEGEAFLVQPDGSPFYVKFSS